MPPPDCSPQPLPHPAPSRRVQSFQFHATQIRSVRTSARDLRPRGQVWRGYPKETAMKYMLTWTERPQGSPIEYENAQKRILEVFRPWTPPAGFKIESFHIRVGDWGGYMLL